MSYSRINFIILYYPHKIFLGSNLILDIYIFSVGNGTYLTDGSFQSLIKGIRKMSVGQGCAVIIIWKKKKRVFDPQFLFSCHLNIIFFPSDFSCFVLIRKCEKCICSVWMGVGVRANNQAYWMEIFSYPVLCYNREQNMFMYEFFFLLEKNFVAKETIFKIQ